MEFNMVSWFEVPVTDMDRAKKFYEEVFDIEIQVQAFKEILMGWFPFEEGKPGATGSLVKHDEWYKPSNVHGPLVYFSSKDVQIELDKVEKAGGNIVQHKTLINEETGYMGVFIDSEGNRIALHSSK